MPEYLYELKIPRARVAVLIGKRGQAKRELEKTTNTKIEVDSKEGDIAIKGADPLGLYNAREICKAIGRGFNPEMAMQLLKPDYSFEEIALGDNVKSRDQFIRLKGRVIGAEGRARRNIEQLTEAGISVYGKTICVIGEADKAKAARRAIEMLILGKPHAVVYKWLEARRREIKRREILGSDVELKNR